MSTAGETARRPRWPWVLIIVLVVVAALVAAFFLVDGFVRSTAEERIAGEIADGIPGASAEDVAVSIQGPSVLAQLLTGELDQVDVEGDDLEVGGVPVTLSVSAAGVPVDTGEPIDIVKGIVSLNAAAVNELVAKADRPGTIELGDGVVTYEVGRRVFGIPLTFLVTATPTATGGGIAFSPESAELAVGSVTVDLSGIVADVVSSEGFSVCLADSLPVGAEVVGVDVAPDHLELALQAKGLVIDDAATTGTC